jgi:hypothetical protein
VSILSDWTGVIVGVGAALGVVLACLRWVRPRFRRTVQEATAMRDSILGRDAVVDSITGAELAPALPGVGVRLAETEKHLGVLAEAVATIAESHVRLEDHEGRIVALERAAVERIVNRVDSAAAWGAMQAASESTPQADIEER